MNKYLKQALIWGLSGGVICFAWFLIVYYCGANPFYSFSQKLVILIQAVLAYFAIRDFRERYSPDEFSFGQGILVGIAITLFLSVSSGIFIYFFIENFHPEMIANHIVELKNYLIANKQTLIKESSEQIFYGNLKNVDGVTTYTLSIDEFIWKIIRGIMFTILVSLTLRKKKE